MQPLALQALSRQLRQRRVSLLPSGLRGAVPSLPCADPSQTAATLHHLPAMGVCYLLPPWRSLRLVPVTPSSPTRDPSPSLHLLRHPQPTYTPLRLSNQRLRSLGLLHVSPPFYRMSLLRSAVATAHTEQFGVTHPACGHWVGGHDSTHVRLLQQSPPSSRSTLLPTVPPMDMRNMARKVPPMSILPSITHTTTTAYTSTTTTTTTNNNSNNFYTPHILLAVHEHHPRCTQLSHGFLLRRDGDAV